MGIVEFESPAVLSVTDAVCEGDPSDDAAPAYVLAMMAMAEIYEDDGDELPDWLMEGIGQWWSACPG